MEEEFCCTICGKSMLSSSKSVACSFCGEIEKADYTCPAGHYVCESCRLSSPSQLIRKVCSSTKERDPMKLAILLMKHPAMPMHGPEHHYLVSCALLAALRNLKKFDVDSAAFDKAISRGKRVLLGSCGLWGVCGAAAGVGIAVSVATKATMISDRERSSSMQATSEALKEIAKIGGPRCCKASVYSAMKVAAKFFEQEFGIKFSSSENPRPCYFKVLNQECLGEKCPYWR